MKNKTWILILALLLLCILLIIVLMNRHSFINSNVTNQTSSPQMNYSFNLIYLNSSASLGELISRADKVEIATGCDSIFGLLYFYKLQTESEISYDLFIITNQTMVRDMLVKIKPSYMPGYNQEGINVYALDKETNKFIINEDQNILNYINLSQFCPTPKPIPHVTITANFSNPIGYIDENGDLQRY